MLDWLISTYSSPASIGFFLEVFLIIALFLVLKNKESSVSVFFEVVYEKVYDFFADIIGKNEKEIIKSYVVVLFFIILISNLIGIFLELLAPMLGVDESGEFILEHYIIIPSAEISFNLALAIVSMLVLLIVQFGSLGLKHFLYDYFPIYGKGYLTIEKGSMNVYLYYPTFFFVKAFDIVISLFLGMLEIIGLLAKIISLSFRLFGNMTSGTVLLGMAVVGIGAMTKDWIGFEFPVLLPVLIYLQEILVALIQALVFPLLVAIFIKISLTTTGEEV